MAITYSIDKTDADIGETVTISTDGLTGYGSTFWIINLKQTDYDNSINQLARKGKALWRSTTSQRPSMSETITYEHSIIKTLTPFSITPKSGYEYMMNSIFDFSLSQLQANNDIDCDVGEAFEVSYAKNPYNQLKFLVERFVKDKESTSNKTTSWSNPTTHTKYPSEKLVKDTLADYVQKNATSGLLKNDGTVDTTSYLTSHQDISGKADIQHTHTRDDINEIYDNAENNFKVDFVDISREQVYFNDYIYIYNTTNYNIATDNITDIFYVTLNMSDLNGYQDNYPIAISITNPSSDFNITGMVTPYDKNNPIPVGAQIPSVNPVAHSALNGCKNIHFRVTRAQSRYMSSPTYDYVFEVIDKFSPIINNLTSTNGNLALSAKQGKVLSDMIGDAIQYINE